MRGPRLPPSATQHRPELAGAPFEAMGVSLVFHPRNPYVPTVHMNVRMLAALPRRRRAGVLVRRRHGPDAVLRLRGGRACTSTATCRDALAPFGDDKYPRFKSWCDEYFFLKHRNEQRGIGGIFFDDFAELGFERSFAMLRAVGDAFLPAYLPIVERRRDTPYGERERDFQLYRRGRYVEFNLVWDRGTHFGLQSGGRTEIDPDVDAAAGQLGLPAGSRSRARPRRRCYSDFLVRARLALNTARARRRLRRRLRSAAQRPRGAGAGRAGAAAAWPSCASSRPARPGTRTRALSAAEHRLAMARLAFDGLPRTVVDARELRRAGPDLHARHPARTAARAARRRSWC